MDKLRESFNRHSAEEDEEEDEPLLAFPPVENSSETGSSTFLYGQSALSLSWSNRIKGFAVCFMLGVCLNFASVALLWSANLLAFAVVYSLGNVACILSTCFLCGPRAQFRKMLHRSRLASTLLVLLFLVMTLVSALAIRNNPVALFCVVAQSLALTWYSLSYIPFARNAAKNCFTCILNGIRG